MLYDHEWNNCRQPEHQTPRPNPSIVCQGDLKRPREHFWTSVRTDLRPVPTAPHPWEPEVCLLLQCLWIALSWKTGCYNPVYLRVWRFSSWCFPEDSVHAPCWQFSLLPSCSTWDRTRLSEAVPLPPRVAGVQVVQGVWGVMAAVPPLTRWALKRNGPWFSYHVFLRWACGAAGRGNGMDRSEKVWSSAGIWWSSQLSRKEHFLCFKL